MGAEISTSGSLIIQFNITYDTQKKLLELNGTNAINKNGKSTFITFI